MSSAAMENVKLALILEIRKQKAIEKELEITTAILKKKLNSVIEKSKMSLSDIAHSKEESDRLDSSLAELEENSINSLRS